MDVSPGCCSYYFFGAGFDAVCFSAVELEECDTGRAPTYWPLADLCQFGFWFPLLD